MGTGTRVWQVFHRTTVILIFVVAVAAAASAQAPPQENPHGGYSPGSRRCTLCHDFSARSFAEPAPDPNQACSTCHVMLQSHARERCSACHEPHGRTPNRALVRPTIRGLPVNFYNSIGRDSFVDIDTRPDDVCVVCHTQTTYHNRLGTPYTHYEEQDCAKCHPHEEGFAVYPESCTVCHGAPPPTGAHQAHIQASYGPRIQECTACHPRIVDWRQRGHRNGVVEMADDRDLASSTTCDRCHGNTVSQAKVAWRTGARLTDCLGCHNSSNPARIGGITAPAVDTHWWDTGHGNTAFYAFTGNPGAGLRCQACHDPNAPHITGRLGDNPRLRVGGNALCLSCHGTGGTAIPASRHGNENWAGATQAPFALDCTECHAPHGAANAAMVRDTVRGQPVRFLNPRGPDSYDEPDDANADDLCATCHTTTAHNRVPSNRSRLPHFEGTTCTDCHTHDADSYPATADAFMPTGSCISCHSVPQNNGDGVPPHGRRAITPEFVKRSHHVRGQVTDQACLVCHDVSTHGEGTLQLRLPDGDGVVQGIIAAEMDLTPFCQGCHDADGARAVAAPGGSPFDPFADGSDLRRWAGRAFSPHTNRDAPVYLEEPFAVPCQECHAGHGSDNRALVHEQIRGQSVRFTAVTGPNSFATNGEGLCVTCHTQMVSHAGGLHPLQEKDFSGTNCLTCHNHDRDKIPTTLDGFMPGCGTACHGQPPPPAAEGYPLDEATSPHRSHVGVLGREGPALCTTCHQLTLTTNEDHATEPRTFSDVVFDALNTGATYDPMTRTCAGTTCHSDGAPRGQPPTFHSVTWTLVGGLGCAGCHGDVTTLDTNAHAAHLQPRYANRGLTSIGCYECHAVTAANNDNQRVANAAVHTDGQKQVLLAEEDLWGDRGQAVFDPVTTTCTNSRCHSDGAASREVPGTPAFVTPQWVRPLSGACGSCHGISYVSLTTGAHVTHLQFLDDRAVPFEACSTCHAAWDGPAHVDGRVEFADGKTLSQTGVCDTCHSPGGPFDGVAEAKATWATGGPVSCAGCHDAQPAVVKGVPAPDIYGDNRTYGIRVAGHRWASIDCFTCHARLAPQQHVDGDPRTYRAARDNFNAAFGLLLGGLNIPRRDDEVYGREDAALCYACHQEGSVVGLPPGYSNTLFTHTQPPPPGYPLAQGARLTGFRNERPEGLNFDNVPANAHWDHMDLNWVVWDSDGDGELDSKPNCTACHDVHGVRSASGGTVYPAETLADMGLVHGVDPVLGPYGEVTRLDYLQRCRTCHEVTGIRYYRQP